MTKALAGVSYSKTPASKRRETKPRLSSPDDDVLETDSEEDELANRFADEDCRR